MRSGRDAIDRTTLQRCSRVTTVVIVMITALGCRIAFAQTASQEESSLRPLPIESVRPQPMKIGDALPPLFSLPDSISTKAQEELDERGRPMVWRPLPRVLESEAARPKMRSHRGPSDRVALRPVVGEVETQQSPNTEAHWNGIESHPQRTDAPFTPVSVEDALVRPGTITFRQTPLQEVVFLLSDLWQINIVAGESVTGDVSGTFHETPLQEVLTAILSASGYGYRKTGNSLIVLPIDQIGGENPQFVSQTLKLPAEGEAEMLMEAARMLLSDRGQLLQVGTNQVLIKDRVERIEEVRSFLASLNPAGATEGSGRGVGSSDLISARDGETSTGQGDELSNRIDDALYENDRQVVTRDGIAYFTLQYTEAEQMEASLQAALGNDVTIAIFAEENRIMVRGTDSQLRLATEAIRQLDVPRQQVRITALIYDVSLREVERLGINWTATPHSAAITGILNSEDLAFRNAITASTNFITDPAASGAANLAIRTINNRADIGFLLQALDSSTESKLLADPSITVGDRREASIRIVQRIPILAADPVESSGVVFSQVQFEEAGVILNVTPRIGRDNTIEMMVQPEYSVVTDFIDNNPVIDSRTASTTVRVGNGHTFVLGGLRQKNITETVRGIPYLKDVKLFGRLFRSHDTEIRESELIVFLKPELITPHQPGSMREQAGICVTNTELDRIAHPTTLPQTCCCKDPNCPNHHPRWRVNGGSYDLQMLGGFGAERVPIVDSGSVPMTDMNHQWRANETPPVTSEAREPADTTPTLPFIETTMINGSGTVFVPPSSNAHSNAHSNANPSKSPSSPEPVAEPLQFPSPTSSGQASSGQANAMLEAESFDPVHVEVVLP